MKVGSNNNPQALEAALQKLQQVEEKSTSQTQGPAAAHSVDAYAEGGSARLGEGFSLDPDGQNFQDFLTAFYPAITLLIWDMIGAALRGMGDFQGFLGGAGGGTDASADAAISNLDAQTGGTGTVSGEQMRQLIVEGTGDADGQGAGREFDQLNDWVAKNQGRLSPEAEQIWGRYASVANEQRAQGISGIPISTWDAMVTQMDADLAAAADVPPPALPPGGEVDLYDPEVMTGDEGDVTYTDTVDGELFAAGGPSAEDVAQGDAGDCYFLGTLATVAAQDPDHIRDMIRDNGDGSYSVRFYYQDPPNSGDFKEEWVTVDDDLARHADGTEAYAAAEDTDGDGREEIWAAVVEKAYAKFNDLHPHQFSEGTGFDGIGQGGAGPDAYEAITGQPASYVNDGELSTDQLWDLLSEANEGRVITSGSYGRDDSLFIADGVPGGHLYSILGTEEIDGERYVIMRNPWGCVEPGMDVNDPSTWGDGIFKMTIEEYDQLMVQTYYSVGEPPVSQQQLNVGTNPGSFRG